MRSILKPDFVGRDASTFGGNNMDLAIAVMVFGTILVMFTRDVVDN